MHKVRYTNHHTFRALSLRRSTSLLPYGGTTYLINSFDYPNLLRFNSPPTQHQFTSSLLEFKETSQILKVSMTGEEFVVCLCFHCFTDFPFA